MRYIRLLARIIAGSLFGLYGVVGAQDVKVTYQENVVPVELPYLSDKQIPVEAADLDQQTIKAMEMLAESAAKYRLFPMLPPSQRRQIHDAMYVPLGLPNIDITDIEERYINVSGDAKIRVRIYTPKDRAGEALPVILYYHGGGMMVGSLEQYEPIVRRLCQKSGFIVVAVDYRMSPEYKYPTSINDSYAALLWAHENAASFGGNPEQLVVAGDSGGGMLTAVMAQKARDQSGPELSFQVLIYPAVGTRGNSKSLDTFKEGYIFGRAELEWAYGSWINDISEMQNTDVQPILANDFSSLPPAYVVSAEYEVMRDDIEEYAELLTGAGVKTTLRRFENTVHPFMSMAGIVDAGKEVIDEAASLVRKELGLPPR